MSKARKGFTLIELLVVIAVIAILAARLFPVMAAVRERGRAVVCQSNLHQIGLGIAAYAADWDGAVPLNDWYTTGLPLHPLEGVPYPNGGQYQGWFEYGVTPYLTQFQRQRANADSVWVCPSDLWRADNTYSWYSSYKQSEQFFGAGCDDTDGPLGIRGTPNFRASSRQLADVRDPSDKIMVTESYGTSGAWVRTPLYTPQELADRLGAAHLGRSNFLFADGSVRLMSLRRTLTPKVLWDQWANWDTSSACRKDVWTTGDIAQTLKAMASMPADYPP